MKNLLLTFIFLVCVKNTFAQTGISASTFSGIGLNYNLPITDIFQTKLIFLFLGDYEQEKEKEGLFFNFGLEIQTNLLKTKLIRIYGLVGGGFLAFQNESNKNDFIHFLTSGTGIGFEFPIKNKLKANIDLGYSFYKLIGNKTDFSGLGCGFGLTYSF